MAHRSKVVSVMRRVRAIELRAAGFTYEEIGVSLSPAVSKQRAFRIVQEALAALPETKGQDTKEQLRQIELRRMDHLLLALFPMRSNPRVADTIVRISERIAKLHGLDAPQEVQANRPNRRID